ncbi:MAG: hypothetical protein K2M76_07200, partial [Muribaculaceae bacterium]|nr:hypothetical protein [Muribaculaceae bacterium]
FMISIPIFVVAFLLMQIDFNVLWRYFAWCNQTLAVFTLWACTVYLARRGRWFYLTLAPALFMTVVSVSYVLFAPSPEGFGLPLQVAVVAGCVVAMVFMGIFVRTMKPVSADRRLDAALD